MLESFPFAHREMVGQLSEQKKEKTKPAWVDVHHVMLETEAVFHTSQKKTNTLKYLTMAKIKTESIYLLF